MAYSCGATSSIQCNSKWLSLFARCQAREPVFIEQLHNESLRCPLPAILLREGETKSLMLEWEGLKLLAASTNVCCCGRGGDDAVVTAVMLSPGLRQKFAPSAEVKVRERLQSWH